MTSLISISLAQLNFMLGDIVGNCQKIITSAQQAQSEGIDIIVFPELSLSAYPPEDLLLRNDFIQVIEQQFELLCAAIGDIYVVVGHPTCENNQLYNSASVIHNGKCIARYHKQCLPNYGVFDEARYFQAGQQSTILEIKGKRFALAICEDLWQAEIVNDIVKCKADAILSLNASPFHYQKFSLRQQILEQRARQSQLPIFYSNLVGGQDELVFDGASMVIDKHGHTVGQAAFFEECLYTCQLDINNTIKTTQYVEQQSPSREALLYQALILGTRDYTHKNRFKGVILGLSGGIDSALVLSIAVDALGADRVEAVMMPSRYTAQISQLDAEQQAKTLGVRYSVIPIESVYQAFLSTLAEEFQGHDTDTTEENIQARCRGIILMAISNKMGKLVLTTGNKSEMSVGYATLYGDMAGGFAVIKDVPKTLVYQLANYRNQISPVIPTRVISRPPSAELAEDQCDQDSLPPYEILDAILQAFIERDESIEEIVANGYQRDIVTKTIQMVKRNEYKRRQAPPGIRITPRAFGKDRRYPITSGF